MFKTCGIQVRLPDKSHEQFMDHWINVHAAKSEGIGPKDGLYGYVSNESVGFITPDALPRLDILEAVDGIAQMWFDQLDGLQALAQLPAVQEWFSDGPNYCGNRLGLTLEERIIKSPGIAARPFDKVFVFLQLKEGTDFPALFKAVSALPELPHIAGLCLSPVVAANASVNLPAFEAPKIDAVAELWCSHISGYNRAICSAAGMAFMDTLAEYYSKISILQTREITIKYPVCHG